MFLICRRSFTLCSVSRTSSRTYFCTSSRTSFCPSSCVILLPSAIFPSAEGATNYVAPSVQWNHNSLIFSDIAFSPADGTTHFAAPSASGRKTGLDIPESAAGLGETAMDAARMAVVGFQGFAGGVLRLTLRDIAWLELSGKCKRLCVE